MRGGGQWRTMRPASASALLSFGYLSDHANVFNSSGSTFPPPLLEAKPSASITSATSIIEHSNHCLPLKVRLEPCHASMPSRLTLHVASDHNL